MSWTKIMECVPNFSEGRDLQKIDEIVSPFRAKAGVKLLDYREHPWMRMNETVASMVFRFLVS